MQKDIYIVGSKGIPAKYGGFETFADELVVRQRNNKIKYHVACMNGVSRKYHAADCFEVRVPNLGPVKAVLYDLKALRFVLKNIKKNNQKNGVVYVLACRIGPFFGKYVERLHKHGFKVYVNPDGHEWKRAKWNAVIKKYWKYSEKLMVKHADMLICDSKNIEEYIKKEYRNYTPHTVFIPYGADTTKSILKDTDKKVSDFYKKYGLEKKQYYLVVGRFVPENNYETIILEFMKSNTKKNLVIVTNVEQNKFYKELLARTGFDSDKRIKFVGTIYDKDLLKKIREDSFAYIHGHSVGGTNPSLLEALASTDLNILYDCGFNREVAEEGALYFSKRCGDLKNMIDSVDNFAREEISKIEKNAKIRIKNEYSWEKIVNIYEKKFVNEKIKILFLHSGAELYGADIIMLELINGLDKDNFECYVLLPNDGPLVEKLKNVGANVAVLNYPILRRKYFNLKGVLQYISNYYKFSKKIVEFCDQNNIDIVHINTSAVLEGCYIKKKTHVPVVWHIHEILTKPKIVVNFMFRRIAKYSDRVICVSKAVENNFEKITKINKAKINVVYNGVNNDRFNAQNKIDYLKKEFNVKKDDIVVGMIGRVNAWKGQDDFIDAMEIVFNKEKGKRIKAFLVGGVFEGQEWRLDKMKERIDESIYRDDFVLMNFRNDVPNIHNLFDIFVLPSIEPDPLPTVVLESMATGKPVVGYEHGGICEMVDDGKNGLLSKVKDVNDLAKNICRLVEDYETRKTFGRASVDRQRKLFSVTSFIDAFEKEYKGVIGA